MHPGCARCRAGRVDQRAELSCGSRSERERVALMRRFFRAPHPAWKGHMMMEWYPSAAGTENASQSDSPGWSSKLQGQSRYIPIFPRDLPRVLPCSWEPSSLAITKLRLTSKRSPKRRVQNQPNPHTLTHEEITNNVNDVLIRIRSGIQHADAKRATTSVALSSAILIDSNFLVW
jgi:hypothetical protein